MEEVFGGAQAYITERTPGPTTYFGMIVGLGEGLGDEFEKLEAAFEI